MQTKRIFGTLTAVAATIATIQGCSQEKAPLTPESAAQRRDVEERKHEAVETLANAHCNRAERCHRIGTNKEYKSRDQCLLYMRQETQKSVGKCDKGIDREDLAQCLGEVENRDCGGVSLEGLQAWIACDSDDLCLG
jgi:hypothetical protein